MQAVHILVLHQKDYSAHVHKAKVWAGLTISGGNGAAKAHWNSLGKESLPFEKWHVRQLSRSRCKEKAIKMRDSQTQAPDQTTTGLPSMRIITLSAT